MKKIIKLLALILPLILVLSLCACGININVNTGGEQTTSEPESTDYFFYAVYLSGTYVKMDQYVDYTVTLNKDGTGYLNWGDDNKGPISEWAQDGENLTIKAGVAEMEATLKGGILTVDFSDEDINMQIVFIEDAADTSSMPIVSLDEFKKELYVGEYKMFGMSNDSYPDVIVSTEKIDESVITLNEDGCGIMTLGSDGDVEFKWKVEDNTLSMTDAQDTIEAEIEDGVISLYFSDQKLTAYYAKDGADLDDYETITQEEFQKKYQ